MLLKAICKTSFRTLTTKSVLNSKPTNVLAPLQQYAPTFYTNGDNIKPLYQPSDFYSHLKSSILSAKERVFIAALYIGQSEQELVDTLRRALERTPTLQVDVLIDCLRGTRASKGQSSATLLLPLIKDYPDRINIAMYHTPDLTGILKKTLPQRFNESIGLMHLKVYGFDNSVMLSGANLSTDYFTNRQDRYMIFDNQKALTGYYHDLLKLVSDCSYQLNLPKHQEQAYSLTIKDDTADPVKDSRRYRRQVHQRLQQFIQAQEEKEHCEEDGSADTAVLPVIQMGPFHIRQDERLTLELLNIANRQQDNPWTIHLTSGYFNFTEKYKAFILKTRARFRFLTASPEANGFFNSKGVSRFLPPAYTFIERQFYRQVKRAGRQSEISIEEYKRPGWTYHAKGLWVNLGADDTLPSATMIGSPNFGQRSSERDLEAQALVITKNENLRRALHKEVDLLHQHSEVVSNETFAKLDRQVPNGVKIATAFVKTML
ncbi:CDP-diacylglycerol--glycerol-3-phosphate 3-phosphatidyltransferase, mitochondrial-like isoform X1 [Mucor ambiguus]|uniref:CDP-diacylglycerol--glycerol-3-phosphate 3-phosphatidyltransferase n=1 Tax=Mucor ambiguus TaxID=91626 RepID=A0A0C9N2D1_9FUNG|nr:CDP-diacylglycerol--glycerol-3-phosphate 3-phosphatidyltransferase, mitochondrial-like isoform X1 [Mucor ambiguus]